MQRKLKPTGLQALSKREQTRGEVLCGENGMKRSLEIK